MNNIIDNNSDGIVATETKITISDEKLNSMLSKTYEMATIEANKFKIHSLWSICWSIAGTLFITILTSSFNGIGSIGADTINNWAIGICIFAFMAGLILIIWRLNDKTSTNFTKRNETVQQVLRDMYRASDAD